MWALARPELWQIVIVCGGHYTFQFSWPDMRYRQNSKCTDILSLPSLFYFSTRFRKFPNWKQETCGSVCFTVFGYCTRLKYFTMQYILTLAEQIFPFLLLLYIFFYFFWFKVDSREIGSNPYLLIDIQCYYVAVAACAFQVDRYLRQYVAMAKRSTEHCYYVQCFLVVLSSFYSIEKQNELGKDKRTSSYTLLLTE